MDLMRLLRSLEEFTFEAVTWLVFYPLMVWRILTRPLATMAYSDAQQAAADETRYDDGLSPPLLLLVTVVAVNGVAHLLHPEALPADMHVAHAVLASPQNAALFRALVFSLAPLVAAATLLRRSGVRLSRETLRAPFYAQCYLATPCCILFGAGVSLSLMPDVPAAVPPTVFAVVGAWFMTTQTRWFRRRLGVGWLNAFATALWALVRAFAYMLVLLIAFATL